jgi:exodeoxyribonuclease V alpha subunit
VPEPEGDGARVYRTALFAAETGLAGGLLRLLADSTPPVSIDADKALAWFESRHGIELAPGQRQAVRRGLSSPALVITGGPGTGKTTLVNALIRILEAKGVRILLGAPTGRAAKRLAEATAREAKTLHRLLEWNPRHGRFERHGANPLEADLIIVDEVSMVDLPLAHHLLLAVPPGCRMVWVGDVDQLPSVGPGTVLDDLIRSGAVEVVRLTEIFRQAQASRIVVNAHRINQGEMPLLAGADEDSDFFFIERDSPEQVLETIKEVVAQRIPARFRLDPVRDVQVLTPMNRGLLGTVRLNAELQALLNPTGTELSRGSRTLRSGDKVMQVRNNYDLDVFNGDIGRVSRIDTAGAEMEVTFDERRVTYASSDLDELVPAYACSIHKSQGNEYPAVVIPVHTQHYVMLQRNLLYTGITRGRRLVVLVGSRRALELSVRRKDRRRRFSGLAGRLAPGSGREPAPPARPARPAP